MTKCKKCKKEVNELYDYYRDKQGVFWSFFRCSNCGKKLISELGE